MTIWFTSDLHFNHDNIIRYCDRPFADVDEMNRALINNFNSVVDHNDMVVFVGDVCMGKIESSIALVHHLNGFKILKPGNHDRCHSMFDNGSDKYKNYLELYKNVFDDIILDDVYLLEDFVISHFPYPEGDGDYAGRDFSDYEPLDLGMPLLCGHVHELWQTKVSKKGTWMYNVGVDVNNFTPVSLTDIQQRYLQHCTGE